MNTQHVRGSHEEFTMELALVQPAINVYETEKNFIIEAEMPGIEKDKIEVVLEDDSLVFSGKRLPSSVKGQILHQEVVPVEFYRSLTLGKDIVRDSITARYEEGILTISLLKSEKALPKKISVQ